jgi:hypothetical protein
MGVIQPGGVIVEVNGTDITAMKMGKIKRLIMASFHVSSYSHISHLVQWPNLLVVF